MLGHMAGLLDSLCSYPRNPLSAQSTLSHMCLSFPSVHWGQVTCAAPMEVGRVTSHLFGALAPLLGMTVPLSCPSPTLPGGDSLVPGP